MTAEQRLREKYSELKSNGLLDIHVWIPVIPPGTTLEQLCEELLAIIDAYEREDFEDISEKI